MELIWAFIISVAHLFIYYFSLLFIAKGTKPEILSLNEILKKKIFNSDSSLVILFYLSFAYIFISNLALAFEGRYRNFEIYVFIISISSYWWLYRGKFENLNFGRFEKVSFLTLLLTSLIILFNETYHNIYSNIWVLISLGFAYILYRGTKRVAYGELKDLALYMIVFFVIFAFVRYGILSNSSLSTECDSSGSSFKCNIKTALGVAVYLNGFGIIAIFSALVASFVNQKSISLLALFFSIGALVMYNTLLGSIAFMLSILLVTKNEQHT